MKELLATLRRRLELRRRRRQLAALERSPVPLFQRMSSGWRRPTITVGYAKGAAALIVEENSLLLRRRRSRTFPLHPDTAQDLARALMKASTRGRAAGRVARPALPRKSPPGSRSAATAIIGAVPPALALLLLLAAAPRLEAAPISTQGFEAGFGGWPTAPAAAAPPRQCPTCPAGEYGCGDPQVPLTLCTPWPKPSAAEYAAGWRWAPPATLLRSYPMALFRLPDGSSGPVLCLWGLAAGCTPRSPSTCLTRCEDAAPPAPGPAVTLATWCAAYRALPDPPPLAGRPPLPRWPYAGVCGGVP